MQECPHAAALPEVHEVLQDAKRPDKYTVFWDKGFCTFFWADVEMLTSKTSHCSMWKWEHSAQWTSLL